LTIQINKNKSTEKRKEVKKMREENRELNLYLAQIRKIPFLSPEEEKTLFGFILNGNRERVTKGAEQGDEEAKKQVVEDKKARKKIVESPLVSL